MKDTDSTIVGLSLIGFLGIFSTTISKNPVLPLFAHQLGASDSLIGTISAVSPLSGILLSFPVGVLSDRISKKKLLVISSLIFLSAPLLYLCINNPLCLIPVRFFHGMATAILGPLASTIICSSCYNDKGKRLGIYSSSTLIARSIAPLFGG
ncbi:MAG: MFS transporter, partial [Endomicrobiales bacterium]